MFETKTVNSITCDFCRSEIYSGEVGDNCAKAIFYHSVTIDLPSLCGETAVIHLCRNCQHKMDLLFERAHRHSEGEHRVGMLDVTSIEQTFCSDRSLASSTLLGCSNPNPSDEFPYDSQRHFAVYF